MYKKLLTLLLAGVPLISIAQDNLFQLTVSGGYNMSFKQINTSTGGFTNTFSPAKGISAGLYAAINTRIFQFGIGGEVGTLKGDVQRAMVDKGYGYAQNQTHLSLLNASYTLTTAKNEPIASPYIAPHLFVHYTTGLGNVLHVYTGILGGLSFSKNYLVWDGKANGWMVGGNLGVIIDVTEKIGVDIHEGFRMFVVGNKQKPSEDPPLNQERVIDNKYYYKTIEHYRFGFFNTNIGLVFKL